jgi:hypothetical protein
MANQLPTPQSYEQINSGLLSTYASALGINDFNVGSAITSLMSTVALYTARASGDIFQILRDYSVNRATGDALQRLANENNVTPITASPSTGFVTVTDTSFQKISTKIYAGANAPNIGSIQIPVSDASLFPATGSVYLGRGTNNVEGPLPYSSITQSGTIYLINLSSPTTKFHNVGETVILAQGGNRPVAINTSPIAPAVGASPDITFVTTAAAVILDGEVSVANVPVTATTPGTIGNVPAGAIKEFASFPFPGASVTNPIAFTTGRDTETDDQLRVRIKLALASTGLGTATAIQAAVIGATPSDENATVVSDSIQSDTDGATLYIDDGTGYEEKVAGVGLETIVDNALGGEQFFQLATGGRQAPVAKAFLLSTNESPFDIVGGDTLALTVGETFYQHVFANTDFISPGAATAYEITASINANTEIGFEAATSGGGTLVVLRAQAETEDSIQVAGITTSGRDASVLLGLPDSQAQTLRLYKNRIPLNKDGSSAIVSTQDQTLWSTNIQNGDTLIIAVDGTASLTYTFYDADFIATGLYNTVNSQNSLESWVEVINSKLVGVTAAISGQQITLTSNLGALTRAQIFIDPSSTLVTKGMFSSILGLSSQGATSDYTLSRNTAQIKLVNKLVAGDQLAAGTSLTEAQVESNAISGGNVTLSANGHVWVLIDNPGTIIPTAVTSNTLITVSKPATNTVRYTSSVATAFETVQVGDYVIIWATELGSGNQLEGRVHAVTATTLDIVVTPNEYANATAVNGAVYNDGFVILRSTLAPQKFEIQSGVNSLDSIVQQLSSQTEGVIFSVLQEQYIVMQTNTKSASGALLIVTADTNGKLLNFTNGTSNTSKDSLIAFYDSEDYGAAMPVFIQALVATGAAADPIDSYVTSFVSSISLAGRDPNELIALLHPYGAIRDAQPYGEFVQESAISGTDIMLTNNPDVRRLRAADRYFIASPLDFGPADTAVVIVDGDASSKSFSIPFYRRAITNTSDVNNTSNFNAYDVDAGPTAAFTSTFGTSFDFSNFKALMKAKKTLKPSPAQTALLYRSALWGRSGEKIMVGYSYPSAANSVISSTVTVGSVVTILINLKSGAAISSAIDPTTEWNVSVTPNTPSAGIDQVTFSYNGTGTSPALTLSGGEYVNIGQGTELASANTGVYRVSTQSGFTPTSTSFSVQMPTGKGVNQTGAATVVNGAIVFYASSTTLASDINTYVNANLSNYVTSTIVNDGGTAGSGAIVLSTYEDSGFTYSTVQLKDGINWIASSDISGSPQFTLKVPLTLTSDVGYTFNNGEEVRLIPTTMEQVARFISILGVTGFTTVGTVKLVNREKQIELATDTLGSSGSIQIIGGAANEYSVPVLDSAVRYDNTYMQISANSIAAQSVQADQWFRLSALNTQQKQTLFSSNTTIAVVPSSSTAQITLTGRTLTQRNFGKPRNHVRTQGLTFRIEKQGSLVCLSWNGQGTDPKFHKNVNFNTSAGGTLNVVSVTGTNDFQYVILTGAAGFGELSIGDLVTVSGMANSGNNGTFLVTGVSDDGTTLQVQNPSGSNQYSSGTFTFNSNPTAGDQFGVNGQTLVAGTGFAIGVNNIATAANFSAVAGTLSGVTSSVSGDVVTITAQNVGSSMALSTTSSAVTVSGSTVSGSAYSSSTFSAITQVGEGDSLVVSSPFNVLNQGTFRIIRRYDGAIWFENVNVVEEEVTLPLNSVSLGYDSTTSFKISATNKDIYLNWNGVGTEPSLQNAQMGDVITFGTDFATGNQGSFMVLRSGAKLQQVTQLLMPSGSAFSTTGAGQYFLINTAGNVTQYYVWFNTGANTDPAPAGHTGVQVNILTGDSSTNVAAKASAALTATSGFTSSASGNVVTVTTTGYQETASATAGTMPAAFIVNVTQSGRRTFIEAINPSAVNQSTVFVSNVLQVHRPQLQFSEYEATVAGDQFVVTGATLGTKNAGSYSINQVIDRDNIIVKGVMVAVSNASLNGVESSVYVLEASPYYGYKHVYLVAAQPGTTNRTMIVTDTNAQYEKINQSASVEMVSQNKMNYSTILKQGLDSYSYNTGLIAEANRIVYGDPRDPTTYPGVAAAGAEIFTKAPLTKRIQVSLVIRTATGVPFAQAVSQVRSSIQALINSNPVGQAIAISAIVSAVNAIPGITAVSISSPNYSTTNDIINLAAKEKARIIDSISDISVSINGN